MAQLIIRGYPLNEEETNDEDATKIVRIQIIACHNLAKKDIFGASDPYVKISLLTIDDETLIDEAYTKTKKRTLNPCWNQSFLFRVNPLEHQLRFEVFDENRLTRDNFLGLVDLKLDNIPYENSTIPSKYYILKPRSSKSKVKGYLQLYHAFINTNDTTSTSNINNEQEPDWELVGAQNCSANDSSNQSFIVRQEATNSSNPNNNGLPSGWEERQDANGRTYYVNHIQRMTQWERPTSNGGTESDLQRIYNLAQDFQRRVHISLDNNESDNQSSSPNNEKNSSVKKSDRCSSTDENTSASASCNTKSDLQTTVLENDDLNSNEILSTTVSPLNNANGNVESQNSINQSQNGDLPEGWSMQIAPNGRTFYIDHNTKTTTWINPRTKLPSTIPPIGSIPNRIRSSLSSNTDSNLASTSTVDDAGPLPEGWEERVHSDGRIFFIDHNTRITQWEDPRFKIESIAGQVVPYSRDYKRKYEYLQNKIPRPSNVPNKLEIKVSRSNIFEDSFRNISNVPKIDLLKTKLWVEFDGEEVLDYGGASREWFYLLSKEMFNPYYGLFEYSAADNYTLQINPSSGMCNEDHIIYFKFIGRIAAMAIYHGKLLDGFFIRPFYKMMLGKKITLKDMESVDTEYYNSLKWIVENDPSQLELKFAVDEDQFGQTTQIELKENGANIDVTNNNKAEYINLIIQWRFVNRVLPQMQAFLEGFNELIPLHLIKVFDENELELLMCGIGSIDLKDWKYNTLYKGGYHANHIVIQWFWRLLLSFNNEMRSRLLQFVTGTSRVPMNGFKELYGSNGPQLFTIEKWGTPSKLPRSHTCFNRIDLPPYESYQDLRDKIIKAIEGSEFFGGVD